MASSSARVFSQTFRFARNLKSSASKVQKLAGSLHVPSNARKLSQAQLARPLVSACGLLNGQAILSFKTKIQFAPQQENCSMLLTRSAGFLSPAVEASEDCSASCSEGSDSSCEAMEGPHGDDDGLVIHGTSLQDDL